jgi:hypothetical protein
MSSFYFPEARPEQILIRKIPAPGFRRGWQVVFFLVKILEQKEEVKSASVL